MGDISLRFRSSVGLIPLGYKSVEMTGVSSTERFTAVISVISSLVTSTSQVFKLIKTLAAAEKIKEVFILWGSEVKPPPYTDWAFLSGLSDSSMLHLIQTNSSTRFLH